MANKILEGLGFHHIALRATDFEKSMAFYCDTLGCEVVASWGEPGKRVVMLDLGDDGRIELFEECEGVKPENPMGAGEWYHLALRVNDVDAAYARALAAGAKPHIEPKDVVLGENPGLAARIAFVIGLSGEVLEFFYTK